MTDREFSDQFDVLYNNITSNQAPGLNEYEKSVFLTKAQDELVKNYFNPKANPKGDGFDDSPKRQSDFATIIKTGSMIPTSSAQFDTRETTLQYYYPDGVFIVLNEQVSDDKWNYVVKPISYEEYDRLMSKPYKYPPKYQAWRLITDRVTTSGESHIEPGSATLVINEEGDGTIRLETDSLTEVELSLSIYNDDVDTSDDSEWLSMYNVSSSTDSISIDAIIPKNYTFGKIASLLMNNGEFNFRRVTVSSNIRDKKWTEINIPAEYDPTEGGDAAYTGTLQAHTVQSSGDTPIVELIGRFGNSIDYKVRYVKRPYPIILEDFTGTDLSINGEYAPQDPVCELPEQLHEEILQRAVELAKVAWTATGNDNAQGVLQAGQRSE